MSTSPFIVNVADLLGRDAPPRHEVLEVPVDWGIELSKIEPDPPLVADLTFSALPSGILARGTVSYVAEHNCRRCLSPYEEEIRREIAALFEEDPDEESYPIDGTEIDLEPLLRDEALLALPMLPECPDGCAEAAGAPDASAEADEVEWRLEDTPEADELRRRLMAVVEEDETG